MQRNFATQTNVAVVCGLDIEWICVFGDYSHLQLTNTLTNLHPVEYCSLVTYDALLILVPSLGTF